MHPFRQAKLGLARPGGTGNIAFCRNQVGRGLRLEISHRTPEGHAWALPGADSLLFSDRQPADQSAAFISWKGRMARLWNYSPQPHC